MKWITFSGAGMLTSLAVMLECLNHDTDDQTIARAMEAPYLFLHEEGRYDAGAALYQPKWLNLYLHPRGFHMDMQVLPQNDLPAFLRHQPTALFELNISKAVHHPVVFTGYQEGRYQLINIKTARSPEPDSFSLTTAMLKRRLTDSVTVYTLTSCPPQEVDFCPLLQDSLQNLDTYWADFLKVYHQPLSRDEMKELHKPLLSALLKNMAPMALLIGDETLADELLLLTHDYRHVFTTNLPVRVALDERIPKSSVKKCIQWLKEDICDRLYELGAFPEDEA